MEPIISDEFIASICKQGLFDYLREHCQSILISGESVTILDPSVNPQRSETFPALTLNNAIKNVIRDLNASKESNIIFNVICCLFVVLVNAPTDSIKIEVYSNNVQGKLIRHDDDSVSCKIDNISFQPKGK